MSEHFIINDETDNDILFPKDKGRGLDLASRPEGFGAYGDAAEAVPASLLIPRADWQGMIEEQKARKIRMIDICDRAGSKVKNQRQTNFCWANGPARAAEIKRVMAREKAVTLSAASVACQINGFRNQGGWGLDALKFMASNGIATDAAWPNAAIDRKYLEAGKAVQGDTLVTEWFELKPRNLDELVSLILRGIPVAVGYNWWSHEVCGSFVDWVDGTIALGIDNSWDTTWGTNGRGIIQGNKILPDDAVAPVVMMAA